MPESSTTIVLDTHVWIWLMEGDATRLSDSVIEELERASDVGGLRVSAISIWEVAMLEAKGRLRLSRALDEWVRDALRARGLRLLQLTPEIAIESARLPGKVPGDPADRIIMASARAEGSRLATRDRAIIQYGRSGHLAVLNAR